MSMEGKEIKDLSLKEVRGQMDDRRGKLAEKFKDAGEDINMTAAEVDEVRALNDELTELGEHEKKLSDAEGIRQRLKAEAEKAEDIDRPPLHIVPGRSGRNAPENKTLGELFVQSEAYTSRPTGENAGPTSTVDMGVNEIRATLFETGAGWAPESVRVPGLVVEKALRPLQLLDIIPTAETTQAAVVYMEETTATNAAAERAEAAAYAESALALTERSETVRSFGTSLPVTDEQLEDVAQAQSYIDGRLGFFVRQRLDSQILTGNGTPPNITGILNKSGIQTQAKGSDPTPDAVYKAMTKVRVTGRAFPNAAIFHPNDWQDIRLLRTADGIYIWGSPAEVGPERIWGLMVVQSDAETENTGLVGDFSPAMLALYMRRGLEVQVGYVSDDFLKGKRTVRAGLRCTLVIYRAAAYATVTGI